MKAITSEFLGTFILVFCGTGAIVIDQATGSVTHLGIAMTFGLVVMCMVLVFGDASGAHLNPAVTAAFVLARRFPIERLLPYVGAQLSGAAAASLLLRLLFPAAQSLGNTTPRGSNMQSFVLELIMSAILVLVILSVSSGAKEKGLFAAFAIGGTVGLEAAFGGPISGASMNPARSFGPALATLDFSALWIYVLAPLVGSLIGKFACSWTQSTGCCDAERSIAA